METEININKKIIAITKKIRDDHPELLTFLDEMPVTIPDETDPQITTKILQEYYESLKKILDGTTNQ